MQGNGRGNQPEIVPAIVTPVLRMKAELLSQSSLGVCAWKWD